MILLESQALDGQPIFFALLKGKFRLDEQNLATNEDELSEPEPDELEGQFVADANGNTYATARGEDKRQAMEDLFNNIADNTTAEEPAAETATEDPVDDTGSTADEGTLGV